MKRMNGKTKESTDEYWNEATFEGRTVGYLIQWLSSNILVSNAISGPLDRFAFKGLEFNSISHSQLSTVAS